MNALPFALSLLRGHWKLIATAGAILVLSLLWWRADSLRAGYKADLANVRQEYALFRKEVTLKASEALAAQKAVNAAQEQQWKDKADDADKSIDDLRARLRVALLRSQAGESQGIGASAATENHGSEVPVEVPTAATGDSGSVCMNTDTMAGLAAYAIKAHEWALSLAQP